MAHSKGAGKKDSPKQMPSIQVRGISSSATQWAPQDEVPPQEATCGTPPALVTRRLGACPCTRGTEATPSPDRDSWAPGLMPVTCRQPQAR